MICFKDIKAGHPVYILTKGDTMSVATGKAVNVSTPYLPPSKPGQFPSAGTITAQMVVDVTVEAGGCTKTYCIPDSLAVTYAGDIVLSTSKEGIVKEVQAIKSSSEEALAAMPRHHAAVEACDKILAEWDTQAAEKRKQEQRITGLEQKVEGLGKMLSDFLEDLKRRSL